MRSHSFSQILDLHTHKPARLAKQLQLLLPVARAQQTSAIMATFDERRKQHRLATTESNVPGSKLSCCEHPFLDNLSQSSARHPKGQIFGWPIDCSFPHNT